MSKIFVTSGHVFICVSQGNASLASHNANGEFVSIRSIFFNFPVPQPRIVHLIEFAYLVAHQLHESTKAYEGNIQFLYRIASALKLNSRKFTLLCVNFAFIIAEARHSDVNGLITGMTQSDRKASRSTALGHRQCLAHMLKHTHTHTQQSNWWHKRRIINDLRKTNKCTMQTW